MGFVEFLSVAGENVTHVAVEIPQAETSPASTTLDAATVACAEADVASFTGVISCPEGAEEAASEAAESACAEHGMWVSEFEVNCWHLGGGVWYFSARYSCTREITVVV